MMSNRSKKALYEVFGKSRPKTGYERLKERFHLGKRVSPREMLAPPKPAKDPDDMIRWPKRPRMVQFNAGRIDISIPYQLAIAAMLGIVLLMLVFFRLGQISYKQQLTTESTNNTAVQVKKVIPKAVAAKPAVPSVKVPTNVPQQVKVVPRDETALPVTSTPSVSQPVAVSKGSNRIVIQSWPDKAQLEPVRLYFAEYGVKTEIRKIGSEYYLVTSDKYENPQREGTDGYKARQKIIELGAKYQAPPGYASFGSQPFHDAYGMKFDD